MKRVALIVAAYLVGFVGFWMFCWAGDLIATLHWTTPMDWEEVNRRVVFVMANSIGILAAIFAHAASRRRDRGDAR